MSKNKLIALIPNLLFGFTLSQAVPALSQTFVTPSNPTTSGQAFIGQAFVPTIPQTEVFIPIFFSAGNADNPAPGFYHQAILLQKITINYQNSKIFSVDLGEDDSEVFIFRDADFKY